MRCDNRPVDSRFYSLASGHTTLVTRPYLLPAPPPFLLPTGGEELPEPAHRREFENQITAPERTADYRPILFLRRLRPVASQPQSPRAPQALGSGTAAGVTASQVVPIRSSSKSTARVLEVVWR
jgi:hypothetical protein